MHFSFDTIVLVGLVGVIGAVAIVVGATAAIEAVSQARSPVPTPDEELLLLQPMRVSVIVDGQGRMSEPLPVRFTLADPAVTLIQIELANQLDREARTAQCVKTGPKVFVAEVEPRVVQRWYNANPYWDGDTKRLPISVFFYRSRAGRVPNNLDHFDSNQYVKQRTTFRCHGLWLVR